MLMNSNEKMIGKITTRNVLNFGIQMLLPIYKRFSDLFFTKLMEILGKIEILIKMIVILE